MNDTDPLRILAIGDYTTKTGLGTALNIPLRKLTERGLVAPLVLGTGFNGWFPFLDGEFRHFPVLPMINPHGAKPDIFGRDCLHLALEQYQRAFGAYVDVVLVCQDIQNQAYIAEPDKALSRGEITRHASSVLVREKRTFRHAAYFPIDGLCKDETFHPAISGIISAVEHPVCICRWIQDALKKNLGIDAEMIYHGVDTTIFSPIEKCEARQICGLYEAGLPEEAFIVGMIGTNQERKKFEDFIPAMAALCEARKDVYFFMFTEYLSLYEGAHDLLALMKSYGVNTRCINTLNFLGCPDEFMRNIYGMADVTVLLSTGEGFGIPPLYSRAMKIPCLVTDCTAMSELCSDPFERLPVKWRYFDKGINLVRYITDVDELVKRLITLYDHREMLFELGEKGFTMVHRDFDYDKVIIPQWEQFFEKVKQELSDSPPPGRREGELRDELKPLSEEFTAQPAMTAAFGEEGGRRG